MYFSEFLAVLLLLRVNVQTDYAVVSSLLDSEINRQKIKGSAKSAKIVKRERLK